MRTSDDIDEVLQALFCMAEEATARSAPAGPFAEDEVRRRAGVPQKSVDRAVESGVVVRNPHGLALSERGATRAKSVVRRHRLAERLLHDVLHLAGPATESAACRFEHVLQREVTESICTLLGHPRACPHGKAIPPGQCCHDRNHHALAVIQKLSDFAAGESGTVAYIHTASPDRLNRLSSFGLVPGSAVRVQQNWPSFVIELGETQLAIDQETAADVFMRKMDGAKPVAGSPKSVRNWFGKKTKHRHH